MAYYVSKNISFLIFKTNVNRGLKPVILQKSYYGLG